MPTLIPHLRFNDDKCKEALDFYQNCFGKAEVTIQTVAQTPMAKDWPESQDKVMHATFKVGNISFVASDMMRDMAIIGDNISLMVDCDNEEQINMFFKKLSVGGQVFMPVEKQFWGAFFGVVTDKYGIEWNLNYMIKK